jgi:hypothetical protein
VDNNNFQLKEDCTVFKLLFLITILLSVSACKPITEQDGSLAQQMPSPQCIESQSQCKITTELADFSIKFSQLHLSDKVKTELPFVIELAQIDTGVEQSSITKVSAHLEGKDMFMGKVPVFFEKDTESNNYLAQSLLANCTEEQMIWRLWVTVVYAEQEQSFFIDFTSQRL